MVKEIMSMLSYTEALLRINKLEEKLEINEKTYLAKIEQLAKEKQEIKDYVMDLLYPGMGGIFEDTTKQVLLDEFKRWIERKKI